MIESLAKFGIEAQHRAVGKSVGGTEAGNLHITI
jgi:hypothetical protein